MGLGQRVSLIDSGAITVAVLEVSCTFRGWGHLHRRIERHAIPNTIPIDLQAVGFVEGNDVPTTSLLL
ncbi:MAG TPA: hypothetical protein VF160_08280, partial [Candidatus Dormibacteraeota bacterium]